MLPKERFGTNLRRLRKAAGLTQMELGNACKMQNSSVISRYERGLRDPQLEMIAALAQGLGVQACDLVEGIPAPDATDGSWAATSSDSSSAL